MKDYKQVTTEIAAYVAEIRKLTPEAMAGFSAMAKGATTAGAIDEKTKELIALAISVAMRCDPCIGFHAKSAIKLGASREEVGEVLAIAVYMGGGPSLMYAAHTLAAYDQFAGAA